MKGARSKVDVKSGIMRLVGPFREILTMRGLPLQGAISDKALEIVRDGGILVSDGKIEAVGPFDDLRKYKQHEIIEEISQPMVCLPGFVDCHTHICFEGSRARDYAMRIAGVPYLEIAKAGGGILESVRKTRAASLDELSGSLKKRCNRLLAEGVTTCEVKSGYGLNVEDELKMLRAINAVHRSHRIDLVPTCLAAHIPPQDFDGGPADYLDMIADELLPKVLTENLARRVDIFIEETAFTTEQAQPYLLRAKKLGFSLTMHVDQFTAGASPLAIELNAASADHLEASGDAEVTAFGKSGVVAVVLPGASIGLGCGFAPARKLLDAGAVLAIASDWNPGSAPMGDLLLQAAMLSAFEKLTTAETFAAVTYRAAAALELGNLGSLAPGSAADFIAFPCEDHREILYHQGKLKPKLIWKSGESVS